VPDSFFNIPTSFDAEKSELRYAPEEYHAEPNTHTLNWLSALAPKTQAKRK
jgi:hypothetical protein